MTDKVSLEELADRIRTVYRSNRSEPGPLIEKYLEERSKGFSAAERLDLLENLSRQFKKRSEDFSRMASLRMASLLLGERVSAVDLSSPEVLEKLSRSLNTIFNTVNQIVAGIHATLLGRKAELETIRQIIGSQLAGEERSGVDSLQGYLDQIQKAFLVAHQAFQQAAQAKVSQVLYELEPARLETERGRGLKFGPLRKAELFEIYKERFSKCKGWFESGSFMEELMREFEKTCQKLYNVDQRRER